MSVWTTKALVNNSKEYVLLKHTLPGINYIVKGVRFRNGYAVVEKGSKIYSELKKIPVLRKAKEYPLTDLRKLSFITRSIDVKTIYGQDVYTKFLSDEQALNTVLEAEHKAKEEAEHLSDVTNCTYRNIANDELCSHVALEESPSHYCKVHILKEPLLQKLGIEVPKFIPKNEKKEWREIVINELAKLKKEGKF